MKRPLSPLRKILRRVDAPVGTQGDTVVKELLECGHAIMPKQDAFGETNAMSRRCPYCRLGHAPHMSTEEVSL